MSRGSDPAKVKQWTQRFDRFGKSGQSVTEFCAAEGISAPSFYYWRQKLGERATDRQGKSRARRHRTSQGAAFKAVKVVLPDRPSGMTIHLPDGIVIELGNDLAAFETVMQQLLDRPGPGQRSGS